MKRLLGLVLLAGLIYGGYVYYQQTHYLDSLSMYPPQGSNKLSISQGGEKISDLASVLGDSIVATFENGKEILSNATGGTSEPIINELVSRTTETLKDLPRREAEKIKYEFCRGIVEEYENKSTP